MLFPKLLLAGRKLLVLRFNFDGALFACVITDITKRLMNTLAKIVSPEGGCLPDCVLQTGISASPNSYRGCISAGHLPECFLQTGMSSAAWYLHAPS